MEYNFICFIIGLLLLYFGAEWLVNGASLLAKKIGLSPALIGLTVVAFATSAPELVVSLVSVFKDKNMITIGNIVGSNICNLSMVLGIIALIKPIFASRSILIRDIPIMLSVTILLFIISLDSLISSFDGLLLFIIGILYLYFNYQKIKKKDVISISNDEENYNDNYKVIFQFFLIFVGIVFLSVGANLLVNSTIKIMLILGISEKCIGITVVAFGTSIPELTTSIVAIIKKETELSVGNLIGSNIFNILSVIGITAMIRPISIDLGIIKSELIIDYFVMFFISACPLFFFRNGKFLGKIEGFVLLIIYILYIIFLYCKV